jgi:hypothetical protein
MYSRRMCKLVSTSVSQMLKDGAQTASFKGPVRTAL